jgi:bacillithiol synthase
LSKESGCRSSGAASGLRTESIPFSRIPGQTRLFTDYQTDPRSLKSFYPNAVSSGADLADYAQQVLRCYTTDRDELAEALHEINSSSAGSQATLANIERLRNADTVAVLTGQQAGLFSGPLYTIYKALSAIRQADELTSQGIPAVPLFWAATEDHDFAEVSSTSVISSADAIADIAYAGAVPVPDSPVGSVPLDPSISATIDEFLAALPQTEFSEGLEESLRLAWRQETGFGSAFVAQLAKLLGRFGLIFVDPLNRKLKELAAPLVSKAIEQSDDIVSGLVRRDGELEEAGYHSQVLTGPGYFPLFYITDSGQRSALRKTGNDRYFSKADGHAFSLSELGELAASAPDRLSPGVMLRPVVQDFLFPTVCYFGGGAEIAYFAQNSVVYEALGRPATPILHRQSFTVVEAKHARTLNAYGLGFEDLFRGLETTVPRVVESTVSPETAKLFAEVEERINAELNRLDRELSGLDATLPNNLANRRRKIVYHIAALRKKAFHATLKKHSTTEARLNAAFAALRPKGGLQERSVNVVTFLNKYGERFVDLLYESIDLDDRGHRVLYF